MHCFSGDAWFARECVERGFWLSFAGTVTFKNAPGVGRDIRIVRTGFKLNGEPPSVDTPPPLLGQHSDEILAELNYSPAEIEALKAEKAV